MTGQQIAEGARITPAAEVIQIPGLGFWAFKLDGELHSNVEVSEAAAWLRVWKLAAQVKNQDAYNLADAKLVELGYFSANIWGPVVL